MLDGELWCFVTNRLHQCDRRTDRQTDGHHSIYRAMHMRRAVKIQSFQLKLQQPHSAIYNILMFFPSTEF